MTSRLGDGSMDDEIERKVYAQCISNCLHTVWAFKSKSETINYREWGPRHIFEVVILCKWVSSFRPLWNNSRRRDLASGELKINGIDIAICLERCKNVVFQFIFEINQ